MMILHSLEGAFYGIRKKHPFEPFLVAKGAARTHFQGNPTNPLLIEHFTNAAALVGA